MKLDYKISEEMKNQIINDVNQAEDKGAAFVEAMEKIVAAQNEPLIAEVLREAEESRGNAERQRELGIRTSFTEAEKKFYEMLKKGARQALTASQIDILPIETIDRTLKDVRTQYPILQLINFAPANVKHWLTGGKTGAAAWGTLTGTITAELSATITGLNIEVGKLSVFCLIPKAIRDLEIGYVDRYFRAILQEAMYDGIAAGYLNGDGKTAPIGILRMVNSVEQDGTHTAKTLVSTLTGFSPKQLAPVLTALSNGGKRAVQNLHLIANPADMAQYVNPALFGDSVSGGFVSKSFMPITRVEEPQMASGKAAITMPGYYTMGFSGLKVDEYTETKAIEDADLLIGKVYGNGRADDDNVAFVFDVTQLEEYTLPVTVKGTVKTKEQA